MILSVENNVNDGDAGNRKFFQIKISGHFFLARLAFVSVTYCAAGGPVPGIGSQQESRHKLMFLSLVPN